MGCKLGEQVLSGKIERGHYETCGVSERKFLRRHYPDQV